MSDNSKDKATIAIEFAREVERCVDGLATAAIDGDAATRPDRLRFVSHVIGLRDAARLAVINYPLPDTTSAARIAGLEHEIEKLRGLTQAEHDCLRPGMKLRYRVDGRVYTVKRRVDTIHGGFWDAHDDSQREMGRRCVANANKHDWQVVRETDEDLRGRIADMERELAIYKATSKPVDQRIETLAYEKLQVTTVLRRLVDACGDGMARDGAELVRALEGAKAMFNGQPNHLFIRDGDFQDFLKLCDWAEANGWRGVGESGCTALQYCLRELTARVRLEDVPNRAERPMAIIHDDTKVELASYSDGLDSIDLDIMDVDGKGRRRRYTADDVKRDTVPVTAMPSETSASAPKHMTQDELDNLQPGDTLRSMITGSLYSITGRLQNGWFAVRTPNGRDAASVSQPSCWALVSKAAQPQPPVSGTSDTI